MVNDFKIMFTKQGKYGKNILIGILGARKEEKPLARISRQNLKSLYFHIMVQGINKEYIFLTQEMKEKYKKLLKENIQKSNVKLLSYCIMSNHAHMLMYVQNSQEMSKLMQKINTSFAKFYNRKNNRVGFVFRDRYSIQQILNRQHLYNCLAYIHNNPVKAGIVREPQEYKYSSYKEWLGSREIIDQMSGMLIFEENSFNEFYKIHLNKEISDIEDVVENIDYKQIISKYETSKGCAIEQIVEEDKTLQDIVWKLRNEAKLSIRQISNVLKINRPKITKIIKNFERE